MSSRSNASTGADTPHIAQATGKGWQRWLALACAALCGWGVFGTPSRGQPPTSKPATTPLLTPHERGKGLTTAAPGTLLPWYRALARRSPYVRIHPIGPSDDGAPLQLVTLAKPLPAGPKGRGKRLVILINNGIHSGESCGIDATQLLFRQIAAAMAKSARYDSLILLAIPVYSVGGHKQFHPYNRVNQNGPLQMGFRGNARNYDLNRDFVKADTANMRALSKIFAAWRPHIFIDNHATNGADYQHAMTYGLSDLPNMSPPLQHFAKMTLKPGLEALMKQKGFPLAPYVVLHKRGDIKKGLRRIFSTPRYSTGFAPLFNTVGLLSESHMLKPYDVRVKGTLAMMQSVVALAIKHGEAWRKAQRLADREARQLRRYTLQWKRVLRSHSKIPFLGYAYRNVWSPVMGSHVLRYDRKQPRSWKLPYYDRFQPAVTVRVPAAYVIPKQWRRVIQRLRWNGVQMRRLPRDQKIHVEQSIFSDIKWSKRPYEGHFRPTRMKLETVRRDVVFRKGDWIVSTRQPASRYIVEVLEPMGYDSFVRWNFFDTIFQQKEYFDPYLFEPLARKILQRDARLRQIFQRRLRKEPTFANNPYQRLQFIYQSSKYYEPVHNVYPVARVLRKASGK